MTTVFVCTKCKRSRCLVELLRRNTKARVREVGCQKVCKAPVAGLEVRGQMEWFGGLDRAKPGVALVELVRNDGRARPAKPLEKRRSSKRSGRGPR
jgi:hypothetical protein